jgi:hypothetical protein
LARSAPSPTGSSLAAHPQVLERLSSVGFSKSFIMVMGRFSIVKESVGALPELL